MTCANPTTTIRIERPPGSVDDAPEGEDTEYLDPWDSDESDRPPKVVADDIAAHIGRQKGHSDRDGGNNPMQQFELSADLCDLRKDDCVVDKTTLLRYRVEWVFDRVSASAPMLERTVASIMRVDGATRSPAR